MVVCKFFLQGTCKFGEMCKFEHNLNDNFNSYQSPIGTSILRSPSFGPTPIIQPKINPVLGQEKSNVDISTLVKSVVVDMNQSEKGGQWLFSCYAPYKEKPGFPGFEDQSFEELRFGYYEAAKSGTVEQYNQEIQRMFQQVLMKVKSLQNPSPDIINMLVSIYNTAASPQAGLFSGNTFSSTNTSNFSFKSGPVSQQPIFAQANQNIFRNTQQPQQQPNIFGIPTGNMYSGNNQTTQNIFLNQGNTNAFQSTAPPIQAPSNNIFAQANNNLGAQSNNSIFVGQQPPAGSMFANKQQPTNTNIFSPQNQPNNLFQHAGQASSIFAVPNVQTQTNPGTSIFNTHMQSPVQTQVGQPQQNSIFSQVASPRSYMLNPPKSEVFQPQTYSNSIFSNAQHKDAPSLGNIQPPQFDESIYSKLEDLTEEEIHWFESDDLDVMKIPEKPPTYQMCFKI